MNIKQQSWFLHLGFSPIPKHWHENKNPSKIDGRSNSYKPAENYTGGIKKLKRGILVLLKSELIPTKKQAYDILLSRNFIPNVKSNKMMSEPRFYHYWYDAINKNGIKKNRNTKAQYIIDNYKTKSIDEIANHIESSKHYVKEIILECKRGVRK